MNTRDIKSKILNGELGVEAYLKYVSILDSLTISEASLVSGFSEDVLRKAVETHELNLSVPDNAKTGRILKGDLVRWMQKNVIDKTTLLKLKSA